MRLGGGERGCFDAFVVRGSPVEPVGYSFSRLCLSAVPVRREREKGQTRA